MKIEEGKFQEKIPVKILHLENSGERAFVLGDIDNRIARAFEKGDLRSQEEAICGEHFGSTLVKTFPELQGMSIVEYGRNAVGAKRQIYFAKPQDIEKLQLVAN